MAGTKTPTARSSEDRAAVIAEVLDSMKARDIVALDLRGICDFTDFFVVATARSAGQTVAIVHQASSELKSRGLSLFVPVEDQSSAWAVMDYGDVVVHVFEAQARTHYSLEKLWGDAAEFEWKGRATA